MGLILFDTCILVDAANGLEAALAELAYYPLGLGYQQHQLD